MYYFCKYCKYSFIWYFEYDMLFTIPVKDDKESIKKGQTVGSVCTMFLYALHNPMAMLEDSMTSVKTLFCE